MQIFENENAYINEMYLINGFDRASPGFSSDPPTGSCSDPRARSDPNGESEPKPGDARLILFILHFIMFSFSKMS